MSKRVLGAVAMLAVMSAAGAAFAQARDRAAESREAHAIALTINRKLAVLAQSRTKPSQADVDAVIKDALAGQTDPVVILSALDAVANQDKSATAVLAAVNAAKAANPVLMTMNAAQLQAVAPQVQAVTTVAQQDIGRVSNIAVASSGSAVGSGGYGTGGGAGGAPPAATPSGSSYKG